MFGSGPGSRVRARGRGRDALPYQIGATVTSGNDLIITLSQAPGSTAPWLEFRDPTSALGDPIYRTILNTNFRIASGSTMGAINATAFRLWVVGFDNGGGISLGAINCSVTVTTNPQIVALDESSVQSPAGGTGGSTAGTFFCAQSLTARPFRILGYLEWSAGLAAVGTWNIKPTKIQLFSAGIKKPNDPVQITSVVAGTGTTTSSSAFVDTNLSVSITPTSAVNLFQIIAMGTGQQSVAAGGIETILARGATSVGNMCYIQTNTNAVTIGGTANIVLDAPNTTAATTYKVRVRSPNAASVTFIADGNAFLTAQEIMG